MKELGLFLRLTLNFFSSKDSLPQTRQNEDGRCFPPGAFSGIHPSHMRDHDLLASMRCPAWRFITQRARRKGPENKAAASIARRRQRRRRLLLVLL